MKNLHREGAELIPPLRFLSLGAVDYSMRSIHIHSYLCGFLGLHTFTSYLPLHVLLFPPRVPFLRLL